MQPQQCDGYSPDMRNAAARGAATAASPFAARLSAIAGR